MVAVLLFAVGAYRLVRHWHPRGSGMQLGFRELTLWSFLMASAHGAGLMVLPILLQMSPEVYAAGRHAQTNQMHAAVMGGTTTGLMAVGIHTVGFLVVTRAIAWLFYEKLGLALLRKAWLNLDLIWCIALIATAGFVLLV